MNAIPKLSAQARATMAPQPKSYCDQTAQIEWVLARGRSMSAGLRLLLHEVDEIGISLKQGWITPEHAAHDLAKLERLPVYVASIFLSAEHGEAAE